MRWRHENADPGRIDYLYQLGREVKSPLWSDRDHLDERGYRARLAYRPNGETNASQRSLDAASASAEAVTLVCCSTIFAESECRMPDSPRGKWLLLTLLCFAGAMVYTFPFLRYSYYDTMKEALGVTHTQMGLMQAVNGVAATFGYIPGGWLADRYSPRKLLATSLVVTGLSGFYFSTFPSYVGGLFLYGFWGVSTLIIFWAPFIKATRTLGPDEEQGRLFGFLEGGRGVFGFLVGMFTLFVFKEMGEGPRGLMWVINISAVVTIAAGLAVWLMFEDPAQGEVLSRYFRTSVGHSKRLRCGSLASSFFVATVYLRARVTLRRI